MANRSESSDTSHFAYAPGDVVAGKYVLEQLLGEGGMGAVFRARNIAIDMPVAIKLIRPELDRGVFRNRLLQEAKAVAKLQHPAIVRVFDVGQTVLGDPFIVMELLQGETLSSQLDREGHLSAERAVQLLLPIADALATAHGKGLVHRDVKPDNIFLTAWEEQVQPKLVDFGIVKLEQTDETRRLTQIGTLLGSPDYMSPEQARGLEVVDLRSDVWSLCVVLYEAIAGSTPFESENYHALLRFIVEREPPTLLALGRADAALSAIVARGMAKAPEQRYQSMIQLGQALSHWLLGRGIAHDVSGLSIEAKWISPPQPSRLRSMAETQPTQHSPQLGTAPGSISPVAGSAEPRPRQRLGGMTAVALIASLLVGWGISNRLANDSHASSPMPVTTVGLLQPATSQPSTANASPDNAPPPTPQATTTSAPTRPATAQPKIKAKNRPLGHAPKKPTPTLVTPTTPSDLLAPY